MATTNKNAENNLSESENRDKSENRNKRVRLENIQAEQPTYIYEFLHLRVSSIDSIQRHIKVIVE